MKQLLLCDDLSMAYFVVNKIPLIFSNKLVFCSSVFQTNSDCFVFEKHTVLAYAPGY